MMAVEHGRPVILTDLVVKKNLWAQALVSRPGVHVAESLCEVLDVVDSLIDGESLLEAYLQRLVST